ncbi:MAG: hypothetical protein K6B40_00550 [Firmicutes bacterium]|nr:hypothetical protein [Bacillota bacterium]
MHTDYICYQYQCPNHPRCDLAGGTCCGIEADHRKTMLPQDACTAEQGYPLFRPNARERLKQWMKNPMAQL